MKTYFILPLIILAICLIACFGCGKSGGNGITGAKEMTVRVHGTTGIDSFTTADGRKFGLYGVQALNVPISLDWEKDYKDESRTFFSDSLTGKEVKVVVKKEFKPGMQSSGITYDKVLVYLPDGALMNEKLLEQGYAHVNKDELKDDSGTLKRFQEIENTARAAKKGAWKYWADKMPAD